MQRLATLRVKLASATSIILPKAHPSCVCHGHTRADATPIGLHASAFNLNEMIIIAGIAKEPMQSELGVACVSALAPASILQDQIKKTIVVIIGPCRCSV